MRKILMPPVLLGCTVSGGRNVGKSCYQGKTKLVYYPSNSTKGIAIKGTNLRVEVVRY